MTLKEDILILRQKGLTYDQISQELSCAKSTIAFHCNQTSKISALKLQRDKRGKYKIYCQELKHNILCLDCKIQYPHYVMDFDHRLGETKKFNISDFGSVTSWEDLLEEISKCDIVCSNCHRRRTWERLLTSGSNTSQESLDDYF